ncbi:ankyrin repeat-containing domain protein [Scenedesmus sp. NREL 46B-D3]|nr:ankyrin repeat-containing domain protein [Scenedesmus sp. NREL 46B-D3]
MSQDSRCLHYAALHGHGEVAEYLLQKARDRNLASRFANKRNLSGFTPLHYAVWGCSEPLVMSLLQADADVSCVNDRVFDAWLTVPVGSTPLHLAVVRNHMSIALMLLQHYVSEALVDDSEVQLLSGPSDVPRSQDPRTIPNLYGMNPAQLAAHRGHRQLARVLTPSLSLARVLEAMQPDAPRVYGPPSLRAIAAGVLQAKLTEELEHLKLMQATQPHDAAKDLGIYIGAFGLLPEGKDARSMQLVSGADA